MGVVLHLLGRDETCICKLLHKPLATGAELHRFRPGVDRVGLRQNPLDLDVVVACSRQVALGRGVVPPGRPHPVGVLLTHRFDLPNVFKDLALLKLLGPLERTLAEHAQHRVLDLPRDKVASVERRPNARPHSLGEVGPRVDHLQNVVDRIWTAGCLLEVLEVLGEPAVDPHVHDFVDRLAELLRQRLSKSARNLLAALLQLHVLMQNDTHPLGKLLQADGRVAEPPRFLHGL